MQYVGGHLSAGDSIMKAGEAAQFCGMNVVQLFLSAPYRLLLSDIKDIAQYKKNYSHILSVIHGPYVLNLADGTKVNEKFCIKYLIHMVKTADEMGAKYIVLHTGSCEDKLLGIAGIMRRIRKTLEATPNSNVIICLETDAGGGNKLGSLVNLKIIVKKFNSPRVRMCIDTAHVFAAGYPLKNRRFSWRIKSYLPYTDIVHFNEPDPNVVPGQHLDRHNVLFGEGALGMETLKYLSEVFLGKIFIVECRDFVKENVAILKEMLDIS